MSTRARGRAAQQAERHRRQQRKWLWRSVGILALLVIGGLAYLALTKTNLAPRASMCCAMVWPPTPGGRRSMSMVR
jgi:hypothetical protein